MKKILKKARKEKAEYSCDFTGKKFDKFDPEVQIKFSFSYGSRFDGEEIEFHLSDTESVKVLDFIKERLSKQKHKELKSEKVSPLGYQSHLISYLNQ